MDLNEITKDFESNSHCTHGSLTSNYSWIFQIILATAAFSCLIVKRYCEPLDTRRSLLVWFFDTIKQVLGCLIVHFINILTAEVLPGNDPCTFYLISYILDSSIGLLIIFIFIKTILFIAIKFNINSLQFGQYGQQPSVKYSINVWFHQTLAYIIILLIQKLIIIFILQWKGWDNVRDIILWLMPNQEIEIAMVVLIIPFFINVFIFWITDDFLTMGQRTKKVLNFHCSTQIVAKKLTNLKNCIAATKLTDIYDIMFINTKQKLRNEEDDNLVEINLETIGNQSV